MTQETLDFVKEKTVALIAAHSCSAEAKAAAEKWLAAVGTAKEAEVTKMRAVIIFFQKNAACGII